MVLGDFLCIHLFFSSTRFILLGLSCVPDMDWTSEIDCWLPGKTLALMEPAVSSSVGKLLSGIKIVWFLLKMGEVEFIRYHKSLLFHSSAQHALCSISWLPHCPTFNDVEAAFGGGWGGAFLFHLSSCLKFFANGWPSSLYHQAIAICESDQTSWLIRHRGLGEESVLAVGMEMLKHPAVFVLPACEYTTGSI